MGVYGFDCDDPDEAVAALLVYAIYRSRDRRRYKVTPTMWSQIEGFVKASAKRATTIPLFIESLKPRLMCGTISPQAMTIGIRGSIPLVEVGDGVLIQLGDEQPEQREFLTGIRARCDERRVVDLLYRETSWIILLVRDRLERERPIERRFETALDTIGAEDA